MSEPADQLAAYRKLKAENITLAAENAILKGGNGGGTSGGMTDDWKKSVDDQLKQLHEDFRKVLGWIIAGVAVPLLAIIGLYVYTGMKYDALEARLAAVQVEQAKTSGRIELLLERSAIKK